MTILEKWAAREMGLVVAAVLRYDVEVARLESDKSALEPVLFRLGYGLDDEIVLAASFAIKGCLNDRKLPEIEFALAISDLRALEKEGVESWADTKKNMRPARNGPCPCGSRKKLKKCCLPQYQLEPADIKVRQA